MKIGQYVRTELLYALENGHATSEEIELFPKADYSKDKFNINYPLLKKVASRNCSQKEKNDHKGKPRYYTKPIVIANEYYLLCHEWFERQRPDVGKWLNLHSTKL